MDLTRLFFTLTLTLFCSIALCSGAINIHLAGDLIGNNVSSIPLGTIPARLPGVITIQMSAPATIQVCIQEYMYLQGALTDCNPGGYFLFTAGANGSSPSSNFPSVFDVDGDMSGILKESWEREDEKELLEQELLSRTRGASFMNNYYYADAGLATSDEATQSYNWVAYTTLRTGSQYFASVSFLNSTSSGNFSMIISIPSNKGCPPGNVGLPYGSPPCHPSIALTNGTISKGNILKPHKTAIMNLNIPGSAINSNKLTAVVMLLPTSPLTDISDAVLPNGTITVALRRDNAPNMFQNDSWAIYSGAPIALSIINPIPGNWYLSVYNNINVQVAYSVGLMYTTCLSGTFGESCNSTVIDLTNVNNATSYTGNGDYQYFIVRNSTELTFGVATEKLDVTAPSALASFVNYPVNDSFLVAARGGIANYIFASTDDQVNWNIAVWAYQGQEYYVWVNTNCPNNCMGSDMSGNKTYGTCNPYTGMCVCSKHYANLTCTRSGLAVVWIVLIVIACAIVLAIAVGVPIACYL